jgi:hypothetical protein
VLPGTLRWFVRLHIRIGIHPREANSSRPMRGQIAIAGAHRSGTSLLARLLFQSGLFLGDDLLGANRSNPYGHYEDKEVIRIHEGILADNGLDWQVVAPFAPLVSEERWEQMTGLVTMRRTMHPLWGFKDPRVCLFLNLWKHLLPDLKLIAIYRHYSDAIYSLHRRHSDNIFVNGSTSDKDWRFWTQPDLALRLWIVHNKGIVRFSRAYPEDSLVISMKGLVHGYPLIEVVNRRWEIGLKEIPVSAVFDPHVTVHADFPLSVNDRNLATQADSLWDALEDASRESLDRHRERGLGG